MCTPWTLSKLLRFKPCFSQHNCPPRDGSEMLQLATGSDVDKRHMVEEKVSRQTEFGKEGVSDQLMLSEDGLPNKNKRYELRLRRGFEDERYIVFCFGGEEESVDWNDDDDELEVSEESGNDDEKLNADKQEDREVESSEANSHTERRAEDTSESGTGSFRSRNSDISGGSSGRSRKGSFSFPVLHEEWIGSPAQMPRPEDLLSRKNQGTHVLFQRYNF